MPLTTADVVRLARQARFDVSTEDVERFRAELNAVLQRMELLDQLEPLPATASKAGSPCPLRDDAADADPLELPLDRLTAELVAGFFTVPLVISQGDRSEP